MFETDMFRKIKNSDSQNSDIVFVYNGYHGNYTHYTIHCFGFWHDSDSCHQNAARYVPTGLPC
jgi:hypothetical protein